MNPEIYPSRWRGNGGKVKRPVSDLSTGLVSGGQVTTNPEQLNSSGRDTHSLWLDYQQLYIEIERFKQLVSENLAPVM